MVVMHVMCDDNVIMPKPKFFYLFYYFYGNMAAMST
jgi:hypothetical protein